MKHYAFQNNSTKIIDGRRAHTHPDRWAHRISHEIRISISHTQAVLQANGIVKEPRDDF